MIVMLFGGMSANSASYSPYVEWIQYLSPVRYGFEALVWNEYGPLDIPEDQPNPLIYMSFNIG